MAPRAKTVANGLKRKAAEDAGPQEPPKRTRSSGLSPSHFVPLEGAPTLPKSHSSFLPREPDATPSHKRKPTRSSGSAQSRSRKSSRDLQADRAEQNSSTEATSEDEIALKSTHKRPENIASPRKSGNFVAKVEISARKLTPSMCHPPRWDVRSCSVILMHFISHLQTCWVLSQAPTAP